jgi:hypothetical protein
MNRLRKISVRIVTVAVLTIPLFLSCGRNKEAVDELGKYYKEMIEIADSSTEKLDTARNGKEASKMVEKFIEKRDMLFEKGKALSGKYPDMENDPALREYETALDRSMKRFAKSLERAVDKYRGVKEFKKAVKGFGAKLSRTKE